MKKTAVVTGSSRGIGFAIAKQLGMDGYNIVMVATGLQEKNQAALDELQALGIACAYVQANIGNQEDRQKILDIPHNLKIIKYAQRSLLPSPGANERCFFYLQRKEASVKWQFFG